MSRDIFYEEESEQNNHNHHSVDNNTNLESLIQQYGDNIELLELILRSKVEEDRRRTEEAKLKNKELDFMLHTTTKLNGSLPNASKDIPLLYQKSNQSIFSSTTIADKKNNYDSLLLPNFDVEHNHKNRKPMNIEYSSPSYKRVSLPSINSLDSVKIPFQLENLSMSSSEQNINTIDYQNKSDSTYNIFSDSNQPYLNNIEHYNHFEQKESNIQSSKINNYHHHQIDYLNKNNSDNDVSKLNIPTTSTLKSKGTVKRLSQSPTSSLSSSKKILLPQKPLPLNNQVNESSSLPIIKRKRREMQPITMIIETKEFPYNDNYQWKNNGNTIHRKNGQKSIYYKCSNSSKSCPVNKTVVFKDNEEYLIKYRGEHLPDCRMIESIKDL
ncbi:unnamed protein product [Cunninghamella blakesleeana]